MEDNPRRKTNLDIAMALGQIATPIILAAFTLWGTVFGGLNQTRSSLDVAKVQAWATYQAKQEDTRLKILDAAIGVLKTPPDKDKPDADKNAREWAIKVIDRYKVADPPIPVPDWWPGPKPQDKTVPNPPSK
jgi:hypothetical protein